MTSSLAPMRFMSGLRSAVLTPQYAKSYLKIIFSRSPERFASACCGSVDDATPHDSSTSDCTRSGYFSAKKSAEGPPCDSATTAVCRMPRWSSRRAYASAWVSKVAPAGSVEPR